MPFDTTKRMNISRMPFMGLGWICVKSVLKKKQNKKNKKRMQDALSFLEDPVHIALRGTAPPCPGSGRLCTASLGAPLPGRTPGSPKSGFESRRKSFRCEGGGPGRLPLAGIGAPKPPGPIPGFHLGLIPL